MPQSERFENRAFTAADCNQYTEIANNLIEPNPGGIRIESA
jgi:hypothetical protein